MKLSHDRILCLIDCVVRSQLTCITSLILLLVGLQCYAGCPPRPPKTKSGRIIIEIRFTSEYINSLSPRHKADVIGDSILFRATPVEDYVDLEPTWTEHKQEVVKNTVKLMIKSDKPVTIEAPFWRAASKTLDPGDSINIIYTEKGKTWSGKGTEAFSLQDKVEPLFASKPERWNKGWLAIQSFNDYLDWLKLCEDRLKKVLQLMDSYKKQVPLPLYNHLKKRYIYAIEFSRVEGFMRMMGQTTNNESLKPADLVAICDSTLDDAWGKWLRANGEDIMTTSYFYHFNCIQVWKRFGFDPENDNVNTEAKCQMLYYSTLKQNFKGQLRERLLQFVLAEEVMKDLGYNHPLTATLLKDYYNQPGFPQHKQWMREFEKKAARLYAGNADANDRTAPAFQLTDTRGNGFTNRDIKGKLALLDFWFSGCTGCVQMTPLLQKVEKIYTGDKGIAFVSVSTDADKSRWLKSIEQKKYTTGSGLNLYTGGKGANHAMIQDYNISAYPELYIIDAWGQMHFPVPDPRKDSGAALISLLGKLRATMDDGPYVLYRGKDSIQLKTVLDGKVDSSIIVTSKLKGTPIVLSVMTDEFPRSFRVALKPFLQTEPVEYPQPEKLLVLSDIEGNFDALRKLLQLNGVMDSQFNWTFAQGHLVLVGDMVDRGEQVMECLWLIYALEEKAKQAGGYVHFILGNHEVLNMSGDLRYVQKKYHANAKLLQETYKDLVGENSELGRWLRTKNIMEKIGNVLFTHGGIAREVNNMPLTLQQINDLIRPHYASRDEFKENIKTPELRLLFNGAISPFWYRAYYKGSDQENIIDSSLQRFGVDRIITGHTIVTDTISIHFAGKVINTDVHHAGGKSEALLIEGDKYYRVDADGRKQPLILPTDTPSITVNAMSPKATH